MEFTDLGVIIAGMFKRNTYEFNRGTKGVIELRVLRDHENAKRAYDYIQTWVEKNTMLCNHHTYSYFYDTAVEYYGRKWMEMFWIEPRYCEYCTFNSRSAE